MRKILWTASFALAGFFGMALGESALAQPSPTLPKPVAPKTTTPAPTASRALPPAIGATRGTAGQAPAPAAASRAAAGKVAPTAGNAAGARPVRSLATALAERATVPAGAEEAAIRKTVDAFLQAYNSGDAGALTELFTEQGEITDTDGNTYHGRDAIKNIFIEIFENNPEAQMEVTIESVRFLSPSVAVEEGSTNVKYNPTHAGEVGRYSTIHVKENGQWKMASARDLPDDEITGKAELEQLDWLEGRWVDESPAGLVKTAYRWTDNHRFLLGEFTLHVKGLPAMKGTQRIGWDPLAKQIRSWIFDSEGGFADALWTREGNRWLVKVSGVSRNGESTSATQIITSFGPDKYTFESHDRVAGGDPASDIAPITVVREPPEPLK